MSLARAWGRQLLGASGVALVAPLAVAAALIALAMAGSFGRIGSLGQTFAGPAAPVLPHIGLGGTGSPHSALAGVLTGAAVSPVPLRSRRGARTGTRAAHVPTGGRTRPAGGTGTSPGSPGSTGSGGAPVSPGSPGSPGSGGSPGPGTPPPAPPPPTVVDRVVGVATSVTKQVPGPVGALATSTLDAVGATVDRILPVAVPAPTTAAPLGLKLP